MITKELIKKILINYYSKAPENRDSTSLNELEGNEDFIQLNKSCLYALSDLETIIAATALLDPDRQPIEQVKECLQKVNKLDSARYTIKLDFFDALVDKRLVPEWDIVDKKYSIHYTTQKKRIIELRDYFLSYTNRCASDTNEIFKKIIKNSKIDKSKNNLARLIDDKLRSENLFGFYDNHSMQCGEDIEESVEEACKGSICFVQIIGPKSWATISYNKNWCYEEYKYFKTKTEQESHIAIPREFYIVQDKSDLSCAKPDPIKDWYERVQAVKQISKLPKKTTHKFNATISNLAKEIGESRAKYIEQIIEYGL